MASTYKNVIFDLYGTLIRIHTDYQDTDVWTHMAYHLSTYGADYTPVVLKNSYDLMLRDENRRLSLMNHSEWPEFSVENVFRRLLREAYKNHKARILDEMDEMTLAKDLAQMRRTLIMKEFRLYRGTLQLLTRLREEGKGVYLLSNAQRIYLVPELERTGLWPLFDDIYISSDFGFRKPDPRFIAHLMKKHGMDPGETVFVGNDPTTDIPTAASAGVDCIFINSYHKTREERKAARKAVKERYPEYDLRKIRTVQSLSAAGKWL
ncbi:MAG: HAD family hydrolase [Lachnospiraceae bacterium]|nr:HAD family hydrolase [Lachnospiraceae bacterium]